MAPCGSMLLSMFSYDSLCLQMVSLRLPMALLVPFCSLLSPFGPFWPLSVSFCPFFHRLLLLPVLLLLPHYGPLWPPLAFVGPLRFPYAPFGPIWLVLVRLGLLWLIWPF